jgi:hypothetical protein
METFVETTIPTFLFQSPTLRHTVTQIPPASQPHVPPLKALFLDSLDLLIEPLENLFVVPDDSEVGQFENRGSLV